MQLALLDGAAVLFGLASVFGVINYHTLRLPFTIGVTIAAMLSSFIVLGLEAVFPSFGLATDLKAMIREIDFTRTLLHGMLSFLLFAGALHTDLESLRERAKAVVSLAVLGTLISTFAVGFGSYFILGALDINVPLPFCLVFGSLISPTDPVAVLGIMRAAGAPRALEIKVIGESLFNDGLGVVLFVVLLGIATGGDPAHGHGAMDAVGIISLLTREVVGGVALGLGMGYAAFRALRSIDEANLEILISVSLVATLNFIAFRVHTSAPLAAVVAGLFIGNRGRYFAMSDRTRKHLDIVWSFIDEALNAVLFLLIGLELLVLSFESRFILASLLLIPATLLARLLSVALPMYGLKFINETFDKGTIRVLTWGGLKGGVSVALAMSLPQFPGRDAILTITYAIVAFSIVVQGLTVGRLIQRLMPSSEPREAHH
jgi:monovalent cation:H+ antiporter, CPA1 family